MSRVLFTGGPIITFDGTVATALAVDGDRIVAIGNDALDLTASFDEVVQLSGLPLLPAVLAGHAHPLHAGMHRRALALTGVDSTPEAPPRPPPSPAALAACNDGPQPGVRRRWPSLMRTRGIPPSPGGSFGSRS